MKRFSRPGTILDRFSRSALRPSDTHCSALIGFFLADSGRSARDERPRAELPFIQRCFHRAVPFSRLRLLLDRISFEHVSILTTGELISLLSFSVMFCID
jgi:hypothetical protein